MLRLTDRSTVETYFRERFAISPEVFREYQFYKADKGFWMTSAQGADKYTGLKRIECLGIRILKGEERSLKPTTYALQLFGRYAKINVVDINRDELKKLLEEGSLPGRLDNVDEGYVIIRYRGDVLGCGFYSKGLLRGRFRKGRSGALASSGLY